MVGALQQEVGAYKRGLVMASLNINSLTAHIDEVRIFTHDTNIEILAINETKLDASVHSNEVRETRIGQKRSPWITPNILQQMRSRD